MRSSHPTIGPKIRSLRKRRGWDLRVLSQRTGISFGLIGRWERQEADPDWGQTCKLARALRISPRLPWDPDPLDLPPEDERPVP